MGGKLAQYVASERPAQIERLILRCARHAPERTSASEKHRELTLQAFGYRERIAQFQRAAMRRPIEANVMERIVEDALIASYDHWIGWYDRGRMSEFVDRLREIAVPTLAIAGAADPLVSVSRIRRDVVDAIDGSLFVMLRDAGHNLPIEAPDDIAQAVRQFGA